MSISLICALTTPGRVIGRERQLPWQMPADLQHFRQITLHKTVIMGRKTFESIGRILPHRKNIIITRNPNYAIKTSCSNLPMVEVSIADSLTKAIFLSEKTADIFIIGGAEIFAEAFKLNILDHLYLTLIDANIQGDAFFPEFRKDQFIQVSYQSHAADEKNPYAYTFVVFDRIKC